MIRYIVIFLFLAAFSSAAVGIVQKNGDYTSSACFAAGVAVFLFLSRREYPFLKSYSFLNFAIAINYLLVAGFSVYISLATLLFWFGLPVNIGVFNDGDFNKYYWIGPGTALYAIVSYTTLHRNKTPNGS